MPTAHTYASVKSAYDAARKANPTLTPAAWRKAAAQSLGMPYDDFLKIWKTKGKQPGVVTSAPTKPAAQSPGPGMGLTDVPKVVKGPEGSVNHASSILDNLGIKKSVETKAKYDHKGNLYGGGTSKTKGYTMKHLPQVDEIGVSYYDLNGTVDDVVKAMAKIRKALEDAGYTVTQGLTKTQLRLKWVGKGTAKDVQKVIDEVEDFGELLVQTDLGPLTHDLAQGIYKQMKQNMPDATPAVWRKAAADYLDVDYKDFLKAWKKPTTAAQKQKLPNFNTLPLPEPPVVPSKIGKYAGQADYNTGDLKQDLAKLLGPDGNPAYIIIDRLSGFTGQYTWHIPKSIVTTDAGRKAIAAQLEKLGFKVELKGDTVKFWTQAAEDAAKKAKAAGDGADSLSQTVVVAGNQVWNSASASKWANKFWNTLTAPQKDILSRYSGSYYSRVNNMLRGLSPTNGGILAQARTMSSAMRPVEHGFTVFRGVDFSISEFKVGSLWTDKGFVSTSINRAAGFSDHKPTKMVIEVPPGTKGFYIGPKSRHPSEQEFIIDRDTKFRVVSVQGNTVRLVAIPK